MKININKIKITPENLGFNFCQFGTLSDEVDQWTKFCGFKTEPSGPYTNIIVGDHVQLNEIFDAPFEYEWVDGFSPNLNKHLHVGHLSNLILANAFQKLGVGKKFVAILGDTLTGSVDKEEAFKAYITHCNDFGYVIDKIIYASEMKILGDVLEDGEGDYLGSKIFNLGDEKIVGIKSSGSTTYFYQDVALAQHLNSPTLYLTGFEQDNHFKSLKKMFPSVNHLGLGLVQLGGKKMSSSEGNIIYLDEFINYLLPMFNGDIKLVYNILAGQIIKSSPGSGKTIDMNLISNPKLSLGLYLSYTIAHIKSCGVDAKEITNYSSKELQFSHLKAKVNLAPNILFEALVKHAKNINTLYGNHYIKGSDENIKLFSGLISDLELGMKSLGMFVIDRV
jgi:hypothetical protein